MSGITILVLLAFLCAIGLRKASGRLGVSAPSYSAVFIVFALVALALYGQSLI